MLNIAYILDIFDILDIYSADMCPQTFSLTSMRGWSKCPMCADLRGRTHSAWKKFGGYTTFRAGNTRFVEGILCFVEAMVQGTTLVQLITLSVPTLVEVELGCDNISSECFASNPNYYHIVFMLTWFKFSSIESGSSVSVIGACWLFSSFYPDSKETIWFVEVDYFGSPEIFQADLQIILALLGS